MQAPSVPKDEPPVTKLTKSPSLFEFWSTESEERRAVRKKIEVEQADARKKDLKRKVQLAAKVGLKLPLPAKSVVRLKRQEAWKHAMADAVREALLDEDRLRIEDA